MDWILHTWLVSSPNIGQLSRGLWYSWVLRWLRKGLKYHILDSFWNTVLFEYFWLLCQRYLQLQNGNSNLMVWLCWVGFLYNFYNLLLRIRNGPDVGRIPNILATFLWAKRLVLLKTAQECWFIHELHFEWFSHRLHDIGLPYKNWQILLPALNGNVNNFNFLLPPDLVFFLQMAIITASFPHPFCVPNFLLLNPWLQPWLRRRRQCNNLRPKVVGEWIRQITNFYDGNRTV